MRGAAFVHAPLLAAALTACFGPSAPTFTTVIPPAGNDPSDALPVELADITGLVIGIRAADDRNDFDGGPDRRAIAVPGDPTAVRVQWLGGTCDAKARLVLRATDPGYELEIETDPTFAGMFGCTLAGRLRAIVVRFRQPIEPGRIRVTQVFD